MALFGGWVGFQFVTTLYLQGILGWSPLQTGLAIFPGGALVVLLSPAILPLIGRFGTTRLIAAGLLSAAAGLRAVPADRARLDATSPDMLPTFLLAGRRLRPRVRARSTSPATSGVAAEEQGLAGGLLNTSFQFGGALVLAIVTAVNNAYIGSEGGPQAVLDGFHAALYVSVAASVFGIVALTAQRRDSAPAPVGELPLEAGASKRPPRGPDRGGQAVAPSATLTATITAPASETAASEVEKLVEKNFARSAASATSSKADHDQCRDERCVVGRDQEGQGVEDAADERPDPGDASPDQGAAAPGELARVRQPLRERHRDPGADRGGEAADERVERVVADERDGEDGGERRQRAVDEPDHRRLDALEQELLLGGMGGPTSYSVSDHVANSRS